MFTKRKNAIWGRYPCCDLANNAIRNIINNDPDNAIRELLKAIIKAGGYIHKDIAKEANISNNLAWNKRKSEMSTRLSSDELWEKAGTDQPITLADIGLN